MLSERQTLLSEGIGSSQSRSELMEGWRHAAREYGLDHVTLSVAPIESEAKRLGGGRASGMQRQAPAKQADTSPPAQNATPNQAAKPAQAAPANAAAPAAAQAGKRSWMGPIAGLAAGLGLAALASHLGFGEELANFMMIALLAVVTAAALMFWLKPVEPVPEGGLARVSRIVVEKSARRMTVYGGTVALRSYPIALGFSPTGDKLREGDGRTPEGLFRIDRKNPGSAFTLSLGLDYPQAKDRAPWEGRSVISADARRYRLAFRPS